MHRLLPVLVRGTRLRTRRTHQSVHQFWKIHATDTTVVPCALVVGRPGAGKTSVAKAVAKNLEEDPRTFVRKKPFTTLNEMFSIGFLSGTIYVDCSKHVADRPSQLKAQFAYLYEQASWHRPCMLLFDNLDKILSVEQEVGFFFL